MSKKKFLSAAKSGFGFVRPLAYRPLPLPQPPPSSIYRLSHSDCLPVNPSN